MRVCFITSEFPPDAGGIARSANRIVRSLAASGIEIHAFVPHGTAESGVKLCVERLADALTLYRVPLSGRTIAALPESFSVAIRDADRQHSFDIFHGFELHMAYPGLRIAKGRPVIASLRGIDAIWMLDQPYRDLAAIILRNASWITSVSTTALRNAQCVQDINGKCSYIPNAIDVSDVLEWEPETYEKGVIGTVCMFRPKKNVPLLVEAYSGLPVGLRRKLMLVGGYPSPTFAEGEPIERALRQHGIESETTITGHVGRAVVMRHLAAMNIFVSSSNNEGQPNSVLEAAATGVPIIATSVDGVKDIFRHGENALLIEPDNRVQLEEALRMVLEDQGLAARLSNGAKTVARTLTPERECETWLSLYRDLLRGQVSLESVGLRTAG